MYYDYMSTKLVQAMKNYVVKVRLDSGKHDFYECEAVSDFDARQQAGWAYLRDGVVVDAYLA